MNVFPEIAALCEVVTNSRGCNPRRITNPSILLRSTYLVKEALSMLAVLSGLLC